VRPAPFVPRTIVRRFKRGRARPRGVAWFGIRSFWGHLQHFIASAIATEDVDSRDWMTPDEPRALADRVARLLGGTGGGVTVTERLGRDLWIDFIADTGDDVSVSRAVARLLFSEYELPDPERPSAWLNTPRGDILFFGGDTAYPVATADEIRDRVVVPFNQVLAERDDGRRRVLLGIPGNHDWYDGLDGFGRLFRRHVDYVDGQARPTLHGSSRTMLGHYAEWAREFVRGGRVEKPHTLDLIGYTAVQSASYFVLPLAPALAVLAVDRQLKHLDIRQQHFFGAWLNHHLAVSPWVIMPDPPYAFGAPSATGLHTVQALGLTPSARPHLILAGDIHHYRREVEGPTTFVTAGGGGAFLHPAPVKSQGVRPALAEWPGTAQSRALLWQVPWKIALGRSGVLPHLALVGLLAPLASADTRAEAVVAAALAALVSAAVLALIAGVRQRRAPKAALALATGFVIAGVCYALRETGVLPWPAVLAISVPIAAFLFGAYLALLTGFGYEHTQAFTALDHPGFKHFMRYRVRADGSAVDGWCIGLVDPVREDAAPVLVDTFTWRSR
jgi:hypothetical protein